MIEEHPDQYARQADGWSRTQYANQRLYLHHRAHLIGRLGPRLEPGALVLDLACGDGGLGVALIDRGMRYHGVDIAPEMVAAATAVLADRAVVEEGTIDGFAPAAPVAATTLFRALYYVTDRPMFFARVRAFTEVKLVFDFSPRWYATDRIVAELHEAGWGDVVLRPFFIPMTVRLPPVVAGLFRAAERTGPVARLVLRYRFSYVVSASASPSARSILR